MAEISYTGEVEFKVECERCGSMLETDVVEPRGREIHRLLVSPCRECLSNEYERGSE